MVVVVVKVVVDCAQKEDFKLWGGSVKGENCVQVIEVVEVVEEEDVVEVEAVEVILEAILEITLVHFSVCKFSQLKQRIRQFCLLQHQHI